MSFGERRERVKKGFEMPIIKDWVFKEKWADCLAVLMR